MFYLSTSIQVSLVDVFVASRGIPTSGLGVRDVGIVIGQVHIVSPLHQRILLSQTGVALSPDPSLHTWYYCQALCGDLIHPLKN